MRNTIGAALLFAAGTIAFSSCTKDPLNNINEEESRVYITNHDSTVNFSSYKTYSLADSVSLIDNGRFAGRESTSWDVQATSAIAAGLNARGYTRVARTANPDLGINVSRVYNTTTNVVNLGDYYGGYGGYYDPYYWGYSGYGYNFPSSYGYYQSTEALLSVDVLDLKNAATAGKIKGVWSGVVRGEGVFRSSNIQTQVQALFDQSPYLKTTR